MLCVLHPKKKRPMKLNKEDKELLEELCNQYQISSEKMVKLLETVKEYEFKDRRTGLYDTLKETIQSDLKGNYYEI